MEKYQNKYRIASSRAPFWDYGQNAAYFVTICTQNRRCWFGNISGGRLKLSVLGHIANSCWYEIPNHFSFVELGAHVIMPNHVHGIVIINKLDDIGDTANNKRIDKPNMATVETPNLGVSTAANRTHAASEKWNPGTLGVLINQYKRAVTIGARQIDPDFGWQTRYHDHIIRNERSYQTISQYIINNPLKWSEDRFYHREQPPQTP